MNGDGAIDILAGQQPGGGGRIDLFTNAGSGTLFTRTWQSPLYGEPNAGVMADIVPATLNKDAAPDIAASEIYNAVLVTFLGDGTGITFTRILSREVGRFFIDHDVWLTPTLGEPPVPLGTFRYEGGDPFTVRRRMAAFTPFTYVANVTGQPAMSVPTYWTGAGLPVGTHWLGRFGDEATLFRLAAQLEAARPWVTRRPPASA